MANIKVAPGKILDTTVQKFFQNSTKKFFDFLSYDIFILALYSGVEIRIFGTFFHNFFHISERALTINNLL